MHYLYLVFRFSGLKKNHTTPRKGVNTECNAPGKVCISTIFLIKSCFYGYNIITLIMHGGLSHYIFCVTWLLRYEIHVKPNNVFKNKAATSTVLFLLMRKTVALKFHVIQSFGSRYGWIHSQRNYPF